MVAPLVEKEQLLRGTGPGDGNQEFSCDHVEAEMPLDIPEKIQVGGWSAWRGQGGSSP